MKIDMKRLILIIVILAILVTGGIFFIGFF